MAFNLGNIGNAMYFSTQAANDQLAQQRQKDAVQLEQQQIQQNTQKIEHEKIAQQKLSDIYAKQSTDSSLASFEQNAKMLNSAAMQIRPFDAKAADDLQLQAERATTSAKSLSTEIENKAKAEREDRARIATNYNPADPQSVDEARRLMEKDNIPIKDQTPENIKTWQTKQQNNAMNQEQRSVAAAKIDAAVLAEKNRRNDIKLRSDEALNKATLIEKGRNDVNTGKATEQGFDLYKEFVMAGKTVPKTKRGLVDWDILNRISSDEKGGAGSGAVVSGIADYKAKSAALTQNQKDLTAIRPYDQMLNKNVDIAINLGKNVIATDSRLVNKSVNWIKSNMGDNPDTREYLAQMAIVQTEAARVLNNPRLVGQLTDSARHEMQEVVDGNMPIGSTERVLNRLKADGKNRVDMLESEHDKLTSSLVSGVKKDTNTPSLPAGFKVIE